MTREPERCAVAGSNRARSRAAIPADRLARFAKEATWYHTIELLPGLRTSGTYDHGPHLDRYGFPGSLVDSTVLDVGAADGFFSFEFQRRGAAQVLAVDTNEFDGFPAIDPSPAHLDDYVAKYRSQQECNELFGDIYNALGVPHCHLFLAARELLQSSVQYRNLSIYELPSLNVTFDYVFCGDLIEHLKNPLLALENLVRVTRKQCIISLSGVPVHLVPMRHVAVTRLAAFLIRTVGLSQVKRERAVEYVGNEGGGSFFRFCPESFREALLASGFRSVRIHSVFELPNIRSKQNNRHAVFHCLP